MKNTVSSLAANLETGTADNTAAAQAWLNSCQAVIDWNEDGETISFRYDPEIEILIVPHFATFDEAHRHTCLYPRCPKCDQPLTRSEVAAMLATGQPGSGGRPRKRGPRCPCGANTLRRAKARGFECCKKAGMPLGRGLEATLVAKIEV